MLLAFHVLNILEPPYFDSETAPLTTTRRGIVALLQEFDEIAAMATELAEAECGARSSPLSLSLEVGILWHNIPQLHIHL